MTKTTNNLTALRPEIQAAVEGLIWLMPVRMCVVCTVRDPWETARQFRQSRGTAEIEDRARRIEVAGYPWLAAILRDVGPQPSGPRITNAGPGESWHQWGYAADLCPFVGRRLAWEPSEGDPDWSEAQQLWSIYADTAQQVGLVQLSWERPHVQVHDAHANPLSTLTVAEINEWAERMGWK